MNDLVPISDNINAQEIIIDTKKSHCHIDTLKHEIYPTKIDILKPRKS